MSLAALTATGNAWMKVRSSQRLPMLLGQQRDAPKLTDFAGYESVKVSAWDGLLRDPVLLKVASSYRMSHHLELDSWTQLPFHGLLKGKKALACFCGLRFSLLWTQHGTLPSTRSRGFTTTVNLGEDFLLAMWPSGFLWSFKCEAISVWFNPNVRCSARWNLVDRSSK